MRVSLQSAGFVDGILDPVLELMFQIDVLLVKCLLCYEICHAMYVTGNTEGGALFLFSYHYELHINILGKLSTQYYHVQDAEVYNQNYYGPYKWRFMRGLFKKLRILPLRTKYALPLLLFMVSNRAGPRFVGVRGRPLIWRHLKPIFSKLLTSSRDWRIFSGHVPKLRIIFGRNSFECGKPDFTSTVFPIIPVISQLHLQVGAPGSCPAGSPLSPALVSNEGQQKVNWEIHSLNSRQNSVFIKFNSVSKRNLLLRHQTFK